MEIVDEVHLNIVYKITGFSKTNVVLNKAGWTYGQKVMDAFHA